MNWVLDYGGHDDIYIYIYIYGLMVFSGWL